MRIKNVPRMTKEFVKIYEFCVDNKTRIFELPLETFKSYSAKKQEGRIQDFDDMLKMGLLINYHRDLNSPFSFMLTEHGESLGKSLTGESIDLPAHKLTD